MLVTVASKAIRGPLLTLFLADVDLQWKELGSLTQRAEPPVFLPPSSLTTWDCDSEGLWTFTVLSP